MENITTYYATKKNVFLWLAALLTLASAVARIAYFGNAVPVGAGVVVVRIILPLAANLIFIVQLLSKSERQYCVTVWPIVLSAIVMIADVKTFGISFPMTTACILFCILQGVLYYLTYSGKIANKLPVILAYAVFLLILVIDPKGRAELILATYYRYWILHSVLLTEIAILLAALATHKMAPRKPGEPYRMQLGDRADGRKIRSRYPLERVAGYIMPDRVGSSNYIRDYVDITNMERYIRQKRRDGYKHFGTTHVFLAAYVRCCAEYPAVNRFFAGQKVYARNNIEICMAVKKEMTADGVETIIKTELDPHDTALDVYNKYDVLVQDAKDSELGSNFDNLAKLFNYIPGLLLKLTIGIIKVLDYFGLLPRALTKLSPFHGSLFVTSMGSLGIPPIFHHLYNLGNVPVFCAFGAKRSEKSFDAEGNEVTKKYIDFTWTTDERICDGYYYSCVLKRMKFLLNHPEILDCPPEEVKEDIY